MPVRLIATPVFLKNDIIRLVTVTLEANFVSSQISVHLYSLQVAVTRRWKRQVSGFLMVIIWLLAYISY